MVLEKDNGIDLPETPEKKDTGREPQKKKSFSYVLKGKIAVLKNVPKDISTRIRDLKKDGNIKESLKNVNVRALKNNYLKVVVVVLFLSLVLSRTIGHIRQVFFREPEVVDMVDFFDTVPVKAYQVKRMDFRDTLPVLGRIMGFREIDLRFPESGILENYNFEEGERILRGDIIASLDQRDALLRLRYASLELEKARSLFDIGAIDRVMLDQKNLEYESARRELEKTNIYAPSDGYLGTKDIHPGSYVSPQDKIGTFVDFRDVFVSFDVIEEDSHKIRLGQNVDIFVDAYPGSSYRGRVDMIAPVIRGRTRTQRVKIELSNPDNELRPGMFSRGVINTYEKPDALIIPAASFRREDNRFFVYVLHRDDDEEHFTGDPARIEVREITIEYLTHDVAEVATGLEERELIIRELHQEYQDDDRVEITEIQETIF